MVLWDLLMSVVLCCAVLYCTWQDTCWLRYRPYNVADHLFDDNKALQSYLCLPSGNSKVVSLATVNSGDAEFPSLWFKAFASCSTPLLPLTTGF